MMNDTYGHYNYPINTSPLQQHAGFGAPVFQGRLPLTIGSSEPTSSVVSDAETDTDISGAIRARITSHPLYPKLLQAYIDCQKVGAPPEIADLLENMRDNDVSTAASSWLGADPELDDFMEAYCDILVRYKWDLSRPFDEATSFLNNIQTQLDNLCCNCVTHLSDEAVGISSDEEMSESYMQDEHQDLKKKLLHKYSGHISTLKLEFSKKKKKGKLPKDARQILLEWWNAHYKWPYPTEVDKVGLAEMTGLEQKQINNWFINQRKRHWKPSEKMQSGIMESVYAPFFNN